MRFLRKQRELPQTDTYYATRRYRSSWLAWVAIGASFVLLGLVITAPLWLPGFLRETIPSRFLVAYAPPPLVEMIFESNPLQTLPTAAPSQIDPSNLALPTPLPTVFNPIAVPQDSVPLPSADRTPAGTVTPVFVPVDDITSEPPSANVQIQGSGVLLTGFTHTFQGWNNCGPATLTTMLSYWNVRVGQDEVAAFTKPEPEDRNVRPDELAAYAESVGLRAAWRINGNLDLLKRFLNAGYPVIVEKGFDPEPDRLGWMGHYLLLIGYSDADETFLAMDSYLGPNKIETYAHLDRFWRHFNRLYLVVYPPEQADVVAALIGPDMDDQTMYNNALYRALQEKDENPGDPFVWFNLGSIYVALGDYSAAATAFDLARERGTPWRMLWYQYGPYEAYLHVGGNRLYDVITLADAIIRNNPYSEEAYYYKGLALQAQGEINAARGQFQKAIHYNANFTAAYEALAELEGG